MCKNGKYSVVHANLLVSLLAWSVYRYFVIFVDFPVVISIMINQGKEVDSGLKCPNPDCGRIYNIGELRHQLLVTIRRHIENYVHCFTICDERSCNMRSNATSVYGRRCQVPGCKGTVAREVRILFHFMLYFN